MEDPSQEAIGAAAPYLRTVGVIAFAAAFTVMLAFIGSLTVPGVGALLGALIGCVLGALIGCCVTGKFRDFFDGDGSKFTPATMVPAFAHEQLFGHARFPLYVTVHNLSKQRASVYVRIACGHNPPKMTCVTDTCVWDETYKLMVEPTDNSITFTAENQSMFAIASLGTASVPIKTIVEEGFPQRFPVRLQSDTSNPGVLHVSFRAGEGVSDNLRPDPTRTVKDLEYGTFQAGRAGQYFSTQATVGPPPSASHAGAQLSHARGQPGAATY